MLRYMILHCHLRSLPVKVYNLFQKVVINIAPLKLEEEKVQAVHGLIGE